MYIGAASNTDKNMTFIIVPDLREFPILGGRNNATS